MYDIMCGPLVWNPSIGTGSMVTDVRVGATSRAEILNDPRAHRTYAMISPFPNNKAAGMYDHSLPSGTNVKDTWSFASIAPMLSVRGALLSMVTALPFNL
jgi:hypothetical protein